jgi:hypothetical protein
MNKFLHFNVPPGQWERPKDRKRYQSRTVAAQPVPGDQIRKIASAFMDKQSFNDDVFALLNIGVTFLSFKDRYNKTTGRTEAESKQKFEKLKVNGVVVNNTHIYVNLAPFKGIGLNLRLNKESGYSTVTGDLTGEKV